MFDPVKLLTNFGMQGVFGIILDVMMSDPAMLAAIEERIRWQAPHLLDELKVAPADVAATFKLPPIAVQQVTDPALAKG